VRVSGFFRDAFPHVLALLDRAVRLVAELPEPPERNFVRRHRDEEVAEKLRQGVDAATAEETSLFRVFGAKPGAYGSGVLPLLESGAWRDADDIARVYLTWSGYAYTERHHGLPAAAELRYRLARVDVATKNQDNREHDIFDSDDYYQDHGGLIATIRALSGRDPKKYFGDSHRPDRVVVRDLVEEARRVFRTRVVNPKWLTAMERHGYKGAMELAATVDYLFGYDATAGVVEDWMYRQLAETYLGGGPTRRFLEERNPWALKDIAQRLLEAAERGLWGEPPPELLETIRQALLEAEASLEGREGTS
jgi:cobaltochelatase CobN